MAIFNWGVLCDELLGVNLKLPFSWCHLGGPTNAKGKKITIQRILEHFISNRRMGRPPRTASPFSRDQLVLMPFV